MLLDRFKSVADRLKRVRSAYHAVFGTPEGQIVLHDILRHCGALETSMVGGDAYMTAFREGRRSVGLDLMNRLRWTEGEMMQLALQRTAETLATTTEQE